MRRSIAAGVFMVVCLACVVAAGCAGRADRAQERLAAVESRDGVRIVYEERGDGEPTLVFIHGWLGNRGMWLPQVEHFSKTRTVLCPDLAGHGDSGARRGEYDVAAFGHDVRSVVERSARGGVVLVGHSMGGNVAVEAARLLGPRVLAIVAVDTFHTPLSGVPTEKKLQFLGWLKKDYPAALRATVDSMYPPKAAPEAVAATYEAMSAPAPEVGVSALHALILWNEREEAAALDEFRGKLYCINAAVRGHAPDEPGVVLIPGTGHFVAQDAPQAFNAALETILARIPAR